MFDSAVTTHLAAKTASVGLIYEKAALRIEAIKPGEKIPATKLAEDLAEELDMTGPQLYPTLKIVLDDYPGVWIKRGAQGGIYRPTAEEVAEKAANDAAKAAKDSVQE